MTIGDLAFSDCRSLQLFNGKFASVDGRCLIVDAILKSFAPAGLSEYTIPNSVTTIGNSVFRNCSSLTSVIILDSVTTIGDWAFSDCIGLTSVTIPNSVTTIGNHIFSNCSSLTSVTIPDSVRTIGNHTFYNCSSLTSVTIPDSVTMIGDYAFRDCINLASVTIGKGVRYIGANSFMDCNIGTIICCPKMPPKIDDSFDKFENLIVPTGCEEAYANSDWGKYLEQIGSKSLLKPPLQLVSRIGDIQCDACGKEI